MQGRICVMLGRFPVFCRVRSRKVPAILRNGPAVGVRPYVISLRVTPIRVGVRPPLRSMLHVVKAAVVPPSTPVSSRPTRRPRKKAPVVRCTSFVLSSTLSHVSPTPTHDHARRLARPPATNSLASLFSLMTGVRKLLQQ